MLKWKLNTIFKDTYSNKILNRQPHTSQLWNKKRIFAWLNIKIILNFNIFKKHCQILKRKKSIPTVKITICTSIFTFFLLISDLKNTLIIIHLFIIACTNNITWSFLATLLPSKKLFLVHTFWEGLYLY